MGQFCQMSNSMNPTLMCCQLQFILPIISIAAEGCNKACRNLALVQQLLPNVFATCYHGWKQTALLWSRLVAWRWSHISAALTTSLYLVDVSIRAAAHPLEELEVVLRVPPLDLSAGPGVDIHARFPPDAASHWVNPIWGRRGLMKSWMYELITETQAVLLRAPCPEAETRFGGKVLRKPRH